VYKASLRSRANAIADPTVENLHEWRKQVKYFWHQLQTLDGVGRSVITTISRDVHELTQLLGEEHDLAMLLSEIAVNSPKTADDAVKLTKLIELRRAELRREAFNLGRRIYRDGPRATVKRLKESWISWRTCAISR
jgi:hypothetical protein